MLSQENWFHPKDTETLSHQLEDTETLLENGEEHLLLPYSAQTRDLLDSSVQEISEKYPRRYEIYLRLLREQRKREHERPTALNSEEISHMKRWLIALNALDKYIDAHKNGEESLLRERQMTVFEDMQKFLEASGEHGRGGYVKLPTGFGKTVLFAKMVEALDLRTLILVPTTVLLFQTEKKLQQFASGTEVGKIYSAEKEYDKKITLITYDSFVLQTTQGTLNPDDYDCLILDEAHRCLTKKRKDAVNKFPHALKLGFTATDEFFSEKKVSDLLPEEIHRMDIREAVEENLLSSVSSVIANTDTDISNVSITSTGEYNEGELAKVINTISRNQSAVELYQKAFVPQRAICYCVGIAHAKTLAEMFCKVGIKAEMICGEHNQRERDEILDRFSRGEIQVLTNSDLLIEGFDDQGVSVCLNLRPTLSQVIAEQRGGRVLRLDPFNEQKHAFIVDFVDSDKDSTRNSILFADIVNGANIFSKVSKEEHQGTDGPPHFPVDIKVEGLKIIVSTSEILRIVTQNKELRESSQKPEFLPFDTLQEEVVKAGITGQRHYKAERPNHPCWPSDPNRTYKDQWQGWDKFLQKPEFLSFDTLQEEVSKAGITSSAQYFAERPNHPDWSSHPDQKYKDQWQGWGNFLKKLEKPEFLPFDTLQEEVVKAGITSSAQYFAERPNHPCWPSDPNRTYKNQWQGWGNFLGK